MNKEGQEKSRLRCHDSENLSTKEAPLMSKWAAFIEKTESKIAGLDNPWKHWQTVLAYLPGGMVLVDANLQVVEVNDDFCQSFCNLKAEEIRGRLLMEFHQGEERKRLENIINSISSGTVRGPEYFRKKIGEHIYWCSIRPVFQDNSFTGLVMNSMDVTELEMERQKAEILASTDCLTGLLNRRAFMDRFFIELQRSMRNKEPLSVIITDIDAFKAINDHYGHQVGDVVLQAFATALKNSCRPYDHVGRYGGEEFIVCLPATDKSEAVKVTERLRNSINELVVVLPNTSPPETLTIHASFGIAVAETEEDREIDRLIKQADQAMYCAKKAGGNGVVLGSEKLERL
ncbi:diguanylate cyclase [Heliorestis acidaminivorans]|uniref:Diguanylate cyclase n=1 Tax=Heliorestis acidaminivorans TaxID=553427 RepID=A0A6I0F2T2_9FIRM|nr:sensor domain-containing diguanylate cyclase [Heliorestis acidaminivorans]KAB2952668.1 diguanylate cyclase [Heliorestis acidaminivorans]